jgi:hypothetical protein
MGLLRRPATSEIVKTDDWAGPAGRARTRAHRRKPACGYAASPAFNCRIIFQHCWRWSWSGCSPPTNGPPRSQERPPNRAIRRLLHGSSHHGRWRLTSLGSCGRLASHLARRHGPESPDAGEDRAPGLGACWSPTRWLGEGSTVVANAERAKDAAEANRSGYLLVYDLNEVANRVEGAMA